jgi:hypothetical protein
MSRSCRRPRRSCRSSARAGTSCARVGIADLLAETARTHGTAVLCATHDRSVEHRADTVTRLRSSRVADAQGGESGALVPAG